VPNSLPKEWKISVRRRSYFEGWPGHLFEANGVQMELNGGSWGSPGGSPGRVIRRREREGKRAGRGAA